METIHIDIYPTRIKTEHKMKLGYFAYAVQLVGGNYNKVYLFSPDGNFEKAFVGITPKQAYRFFMLSKIPYSPSMFHYRGMTYTSLISKQDLVDFAFMSHISCSSWLVDRLLNYSTKELYSIKEVLAIMQINMKERDCELKRDEIKQIMDNQFLEFKKGYVVNSPVANICFRVNTISSKSPFERALTDGIKWDDKAKCVIDKHPLYSVFALDRQGIYAFKSEKDLIRTFDNYNFKVKVLILDYDECDYIGNTDDTFKTASAIQNEMVIRKANILLEVDYSTFKRNHESIIKEIVDKWIPQKKEMYLTSPRTALPAISYREGMEGLKLKAFIESKYARRLHESEIHGLKHSILVFLHAMRLSSKLQEIGIAIDRAVCTWFSFLHDACRENDASDEGHGKRASEMVNEIRNSYLSELTDNQISILKSALEFHDRKIKLTLNNTVGVCLDADRLDLTRVGITPDPSLMTTKAGCDNAITICKKRKVPYDDSDVYKRFTPVAYSTKGVEALRNLFKNIGSHK